MNKIPIEKCKDMLKNPDFEQNQYSRTAIVLTKLDMIVLK